MIRTPTVSYDIIMHLSNPFVGGGTFIRFLSTVISLQKKQNEEVEMKGGGELGVQRTFISCHFLPPYLLASLCSCHLYTSHRHTVDSTSLPVLLPVGQQADRKAGEKEDGCLDTQQIKLQKLLKAKNKNVVIIYSLSICPKSV